MRQIEGGSTAQNKLRRVYQSFRFRSLLTDSPLYPFDTKEETLLAAIRQVKQEYPDFEPGFNEDFFNLETGETKQNEPREEEKE
ncbi:MAG: hypothetical protein GWO20_11520 [Candidatus Korarchaeota archaeon]|nr:hypothetical protein [Candidatus Korarchaeota archaeon]NIU82562.1 hypothetical protein [Candidatus Thorarchaeota archaeon]NIW13050.1 hypothetical protein [Candidatus Thorarchaeota archaeon]NIW51225.1 hypothetical protein [Candidatus Korarchaeota archaeon]